MGSENLSKPVIAEAISNRLKAKAMTADEVLMRLAEQARANLADFVQDYGAIDWEAVKAKGCLVKKISHTAGKQSSIELYDAQSALEKIGRAHGLFRQVVTGPDGGPLQAVVATDDLSNLTDEELDARLGKLFVQATAEGIAEAGDGAEDEGGPDEH